MKDFIGSYGMPWAEETNRALMNVGLERGHPIDRCPAKPHHAEPPPPTIDKLPVWPSSLSGSGVRRDKAALSSGCKPHPAIRSSRKQPEQAWR